VKEASYDSRCGCGGRLVHKKYARRLKDKYPGDGRKEKGV